MKSLHYANAMLVLVTLAWGFTFPLINTVAGSIDPSLFVTARFLLAALIIFPFVKRDTLFSLPSIKAGLILGLFNSSIYVLQTCSLGHISASRCAFLTGTVVLWVPLLGYLLAGIRISYGQMLAGGLCLIGLWIMTGADIHGIGIGDGMMLIAEIFFALSLLYLDKTTPRCPDAFTLTFYQILFTCPLPLFISMITHASVKALFDLKCLLAVLFCAIFATALALLLQVYYQRRTTSVHASLIFSLEPFWAAVFSSLLFGEVLTPHLVFGGGLMILSAGLPEMLIIFRRQATT